MAKKNKSKTKSEEEKNTGTEKPKRTKPQGKLNYRIIAHGILANKKLKDIAVEAGSLARSDHSKTIAVRQVTRRKSFQELLQAYLPDEDCLSVHREGLFAETLKGDPDHDMRLKYLTKAYELKGKGQNSGGMNFNFNIENLARDNDSKRSISEAEIV